MMCPMPQSQQQPRNDCKLVWTKKLLFHSRKNTIHAWSLFCIHDMLLFLNLKKCEVTYSNKTEDISSGVNMCPSTRMNWNLTFCVIFGSGKGLWWYSSHEDEISVHTTGTPERYLTFSPCEDSVEGGSAPPRKGSLLKATMLHCELPASQKINFSCL